MSAFVFTFKGKTWCSFTPRKWKRNRDKLDPGEINWSEEFHLTERSFAWVEEVSVQSLWASVNARNRLMQLERHSTMKKIKLRKSNIYSAWMKHWIKSNVDKSIKIFYATVNIAEYQPWLTLRPGTFLQGELNGKVIPRPKSWHHATPAQYCPTFHCLWFPSHTQACDRWRDLQPCSWNISSHFSPLLAAMERKKRRRFTEGTVQWTAENTGAPPYGRNQKEARPSPLILPDLHALRVDILPFFWFVLCNCLLTFSMWRKNKTRSTSQYYQPAVKNSFLAAAQHVIHSLLGATMKTKLSCMRFRKDLQC